MPERLLVQSKASPSDPSFDDIEIYGNKFKNYFRNGGIKVLEKELVISCHGNTQLDLSVAKDIQDLADQGHKVVSIQQGGLYFAKPSIEAANMPTVPVISVPLDGGYFRGADAFLAPNVPSGVASIAGVGISNYQTAARVAISILMQEFKGVYLHNYSKKLTDKLAEFGIHVIGQLNQARPACYLDGIIVGTIDSLSDLELFDQTCKFGIFTLKDYSTIDSLKKLMHISKRACNSVYVRGEENIAFFAAKIFSLYNKKAFDALKEAARKKAASYENRRISLEDFV